MKKTLHIQPNDNVIVALEPLSAGEIINGITLLDDIPSGHKFACAMIPDGQPVIKYGQPIGQAAGDIEAGRWIHNLKTRLSGTLDYQYDPVCDPIVKRPQGRSVMAYRRANGKVGIRNELWVGDRDGRLHRRYRPQHRQRLPPAPSVR